MTNCLAYLKQTAACLKVSPGTLSIELNAIPSLKTDKDTISGFINIVNEYLKQSKSELSGQTAEENADIYQWLEYVMVYVVQDNATNAQILKELNNIFTSRAYLVSHRLTIADVVLYYVIFKVLENLSYLEKEKYLNISRWFDNIQKNNTIRQKNKLIDFNTLYLTACT